jgi:hypothetical protein
VRDGDTAALVGFLHECNRASDSDAALTALAARSLLRAVHGNHARAAEARALGGLAAAHAALRAHASDGAAATEVVVLLCRLLVMTQPEERDAMLQAGVVRDLLAAMDAHPSHAALVSSAVGAFGNLSAHSVANQAALGAAGTVEAAVGAARRHADHAFSQACVFRALHALALHAPNAARAGAAGGVEAATDALARHGDDVEVSRSACLALSTLLIDEACSARAAAAGAAPRLLDVLRRHGDDAEAAYQALTAVGNYCGSADRGRGADVGEAGAQLALAALAAHGGGPVASRAAHVLLRLSHARRAGGAAAALDAARPALAASAEALAAADDGGPSALARTLLEQLLGRLERGPCAHCGDLAEPRALKRCSRCRAARYCCVACATAAWPTHKAVCAPAPAAPSAAAGSSVETPAAAADVTRS